MQLVLLDVNETTCFINPLMPNDPYSGRTAPLTSKRCILYNYSTNIGTEYFKHGIYSPFFPLQNAVCFIILTYFVPILFTFYIQCVLKLKKNNSGAKRLTSNETSSVLTYFTFILTFTATHTAGMPQIQNDCLKETSQIFQPVRVLCHTSKKWRLILKI